MMNRIFAYITHHDGVPDDCAAESLAFAKELNPSASIAAIVTGHGAGIESVCKELQSSYSEIWKISNEALAYANAELVRKALVSVLPPASVVILSHSHFGMDLAPGLAVKLEAAFVADVVAIDGVSGSSLRVTRREFGGQLSAHVVCDASAGAVITFRPGVFKPVEQTAIGTVTDKSADIGPLTAKRRYLSTVLADSNDLDISKEPVLVAVGRGIQDKENIALVEELAEALGAAVCCSRPVVDANWLPKSRQVGSSGKTVKPKVYLTCGVSGSFQHLAGVKGNPLLVAINKNPKAPIFQIADIGVVDDLLEFLPLMTERLRAAVK